MLTVHHLSISQSERIVWLMEELDLPYNLVRHIRSPMLSPDSLKSVPGNGLGKAPFLEDVDAGITLSESGAICEYIIHKYANGKLALSPDDKYYADYLYWFHYANGTLMPAFYSSMFLRLAEGVSDDAMIKKLAQKRLDAALELLDERLKGNKWLAGEEFTAADVMTVYPVTTQRYWGPPLNLSGYPGVSRWLEDVGKREGYKRAMEKGDPEMKPLLGNEAPEKGLMEVGGVESQIWRK